MREAELADLDHELAQGPRLVRDVVFGACVGAVIGWLGFGGRRQMIASVAQGAGAGAAVCLVAYGFGQWKSAKEHEQLDASTGKHVTGTLAPYPFHAPSVTYPWSSH